MAWADIGTAVDNVFVQTPRGYLLSNNSVLVYDNVYGGLGLTEALWWNLEEYAEQLLRGATSERGRWAAVGIYPENANRLVKWLDEVNDEPEPLPEDPGPGDWWRIIRPGSRVCLYQRDRDDVAEGMLAEPVWQDGVKYVVDTPGDGQVTVVEEQLGPQESSFDWLVWQPSTGRDQELQTEGDF